MASTKPGYAQHDAGVLVGGKLSVTAEDKFITDVQNELQFGSPSTPSLFPCLPKLKPIGFTGIDLHDRAKFGELYNTGLKNYEAIAQALDVKGTRTLFPILFDPISFAIDFGLDIPDVSLPNIFLAIPEIMVQLPDLLIKLGIPSIPIPSLPTLNVPKIDFGLSLPELNLFFAWYLKLPDLFLNLALKMPEIGVKIPALDFGPFCSAIKDAELFGKMDPSQLTRLAVNKVLMNKAGECMVIAVTAAVLGSADKGITGGLGKEFGVKDPESPPSPSGKTILAVAGIELTTPAFRLALVRTAERLNINPDWLAAVISLESAKTFSPSIKNKESGAIGLIQFLGSTAKKLGTTVDQLAAMTAIEQLTYVEKYYVSATDGGKRKLKTLEDVYLAVFYPVAMGKSPGAVVLNKNDPDPKKQKDYLQNKAYDKNKDDIVTAGEIAGSINGVVNAAKGRRISCDDGSIT